jgi:hypothetical protein
VEFHPNTNDLSNLATAMRTAPQKNFLTKASPKNWLAQLAVLGGDNPIPMAHPHGSEQTPYPELRWITQDRVTKS